MSARAIATVRDVVEIVAILAAGIWAFYVFAYENRIKPSMANPDIDVTASMQKISERNGLIAVSLHVQFRNIGTVRADLLAAAINVYGQRVLETEPRAGREAHPLRYVFAGYCKTGPLVPVYSNAYVTHHGDPATTEYTDVDPGSTLDDYWTFYVPRGRFDLLTLSIDAPYTKYLDSSFPTQLITTPQGDVRVVVNGDHSKIEQYNTIPVTSLDLR
ncbi:MAG: hypothetical protein JO322_12180 [Candidatus Eremiobacteraeota bacterium]|nr:hypothetical protein [Candidatus Eremiobacteraeota bacterium]